MEIERAQRWLDRLNVAGEKQAAEIRLHGPKTHYERLVLAEAEFCPDCNGKANECRLAAVIWTKDFCPRCFGHFSYEIELHDKEGVKTGIREVYVDSEPYHELRSDGATVFRRCDCIAAQRQYGMKFDEHMTGGHGLCAVKRWAIEFARTHRRATPPPEARNA